MAPVRRSTTSPGSMVTPAISQAASRSAPVNAYPPSMTSTPLSRAMSSNTPRDTSVFTLPIPQRAAPASVMESAGWPFQRLPP